MSLCPTEFFSFFQLMLWLSSALFSDDFSKRKKSSDELAASAQHQTTEKTKLSLARERSGTFSSQRASFPSGHLHRVKRKSKYLTDIYCNRMPERQLMLMLIFAGNCRLWRPEQGYKEHGADSEE